MTDACVTLTSFDWCMLLAGMVAFHDGQVIWSDLDDITTFLMYDFVRIEEMHAIRNDVARLRGKWSGSEWSGSKWSVRS